MDSNQQPATSNNVHSTTTVVHDKMCFQDIRRENDEIRLIRYRHWSPAMPIFDFETTVASLNTPLSYKAISYTWGSSTTPITTPFDININGQPWYVSSNLHYALMQVCATPSRNTWLWVDALCVNLDDPDERSWQVAHMPRIFGSADSVFFCIGPAADESDSLFDFFIPWGQHAANAEIYPGDGALYDTAADPFPTTKTGKFIHMLIKTKDIYDKGMHAAVGALARRPNWNRCWIMQELILANDGLLLCGQKVIPLHHFHAMMLALSRVSAWRGAAPRIGHGCLFNPSAAYKAVLGIDARIRGPSPNATLHYFLTSRARMANTVASQGPFYEARDPRDVIFAFLGIASDRDRIGIVPDYSTTTRDVYTAATLAMFQSDPQQHILQLASFPKDIPYLPTWVPDWSRIGRLGLQAPLSQNETFSVFRTPQPVPEIAVIDGHILQRRGFPCGIVKCAFQFSAAASTDDKDRQAAAFSLALQYHRAACIPNLLEFVYLYAFDLSSDEGTPETRLWRALTADLYRDIEPLNGYDEFNRRMLGLTPLPNGGRPTASIHYILEYSESDRDKRVPRHPRKFTAEAWDQAVQVARNRTLFATEDGRIGLGPYLTQPGDVVTALAGSSVPVILRPEDCVYRHLGEAYVEGIMYGELGLDEGLYQDQVFDIV